MVSVMRADKNERTNRNAQVGMQKGALFSIVSTTLLNGLIIEPYEIFASQWVYQPHVF